MQVIILKKRTNKKTKTTFQTKKGSRRKEEFTFYVVKRAHTLCIFNASMDTITCWSCIGLHCIKVYLYASPSIFLFIYPFCEYFCFRFYLLMEKCMSNISLNGCFLVVYSFSFSLSLSICSKWKIILFFFIYKKTH